MDKKSERKRGKPVTHPKIVCVDTGELFDTYTEAANAIGGSRWGVMRCCFKMQKHHRGYHFIFTRV